MKILTLSVETIPNSDWLKDQEDKNSFPPLTEQIPVLIQWLRVGTGSTVEGEIENFSIKDGTNWIPNALTRLTAHIDQADRLVTYNGRSFTVPLLTLHAIANKINWNWYCERNHRFPTYNNPLFHWDMLDQLTNYGAAKLFNLNSALKLLKLSEVEELNPETISKLVHTNHFKTLKKANARKIIQICLLYNKFVEFTQKEKFNNLGNFLERLKEKIG